MADAVCVWEKHWPSGFNWKVLAENFMEPYHHMGSYSKSLEPMLPAKGCWTEPPTDHYCAAHLPVRDAMLEESDGGRALCTFQPFPGMTEDDYRHWWAFLGFPTFLMFNALDRFYWYRLIPTSPTTSSLMTMMFVHPDAMDAEDYAATLEKEIDLIVSVHTEDIEACVGIQRGMASVGYAAGRLSHLEEPIWQIQRYLARHILHGGAAS